MILDRLFAGKMQPLDFLESAEIRHSEVDNVIDAIYALLARPASAPSLPNGIQFAHCELTRKAQERFSGQGRLPMSIKSSAFGGVVLTGDDAKKFRAQVTYGRPKRAAQEAVAEGVRLSRELREHGSITLRLLEPA